MATWEPNVNIVSIEAVDQPGEPANSGAIQIDWAINEIQNPSQSGTLTATILIGGTVVESA
jgi:hypothetical protein